MERRLYPLPGHPDTDLGLDKMTLHVLTASLVVQVAIVNSHEMSDLRTRVSGVVTESKVDTPSVPLRWASALYLRIQATISAGRSATHIELQAMSEPGERERARFTATTACDRGSLDP